MGMVNNRGSTWRKWDLHVHAPSRYTCAKNDQFERSSLADKQDKFIEQVKNLKDVSVLGITDYFSLDGYESVIKKKEDISNIDLILPNIELRLSPETNDAKKINIHLIPNIDILEIDEIKRFIHKFEHKQQGESHTCEHSSLIKLGKKLDDSLSDEKAFVKGLNEFSITYQNFFEAYNEQDDKFKNNTLIGVSNNSTDGVSGIKDLESIRNIIYEGVDFIFSANKSDREYFLGESNSDNISEIVKKYKSLKPCIHGSDYHGSKSNNKQLCIPDFDRFCWIKANPTFEGLKQITYEPKERVRIQEANPEFTFNKPYFEEISINADVAIFNDDEVQFKTNQIPLNKDLITIIGGRGSGKSLLVNYIGNIFSQINTGEYSTSDFSDSEDFSIDYNNDNQPNNASNSNNYSGANNNLDFVFIRQSEIKGITEKSALKGKITQMLGVEDSFNENLSDNINVILTSIRDIKKWLNNKDDNSNLINDKEYQEKIKRDNDNLLKTITTESNKENLEKYTKNIGSIEKANKKEYDILDIKEYLNNVNSEISRRLISINDGLVKELQVERSDVFSNLIVGLEKIKTSIASYSKKLNKENETIKQKFNDIGYSGDLSSLLKNAELYQKNIENADKKLADIKENLDKLLEFKSDRKNIGNLLKQEYEKQKSNLQGAWHSLLSNKSENHKDLIEKIIFKDDINFIVNIDFNSKEFYRLIFREIDNRKFKTREKLEKEFHINSFDSWVNFFNDDKFDLIMEDDDFSYFIEKIFFDSELRGKYIKVVPELTYKGKSIDKLSAGQKGTLYLRLVLATNSFTNPIIFDQPEDDLDNEFIVNELIPLIRELKQYRQIILVTHNANIVVNGDSEQVIVAENDDDSLSYISGAIEDNEIQNSICKILEGGKEAFKTRGYKLNI
jgi:hypothetical protein